MNLHRVVLALFVNLPPWSAQTHTLTILQPQQLMEQGANLKFNRLTTPSGTAVALFPHHQNS
jgi:hypothetical protein